MTPSRCSILFADIRGYTPIAGKLDPETLNRLLEGYVREMSAPVRRHRGTVDKVLGDGILACFEGRDQAVRAVRAALEMQERARVLRPRWRAAGPGVDLLVRIGIATGDVVRGSLVLADRREPTAVGGPVNLASRLQEKAPPGGVLVCPGTRQSAGGDFPFVPMEGVEVRGLDDALTAWLLPSDERPAPPEEAAPPWDGRERRKVSLEKRRHRRRDRQVALGLRVGEVTTPCRSLNISEGGILLETDSPGAVGSEVVILARMPSGGGGLPLDIRGKVVRIVAAGGHRGVGVAFLEAATASPATLARLVGEAFELGALPGPGPAGLPPTLPELGPVPTLGGRELPLTYRELGTGDPAHLMGRLEHEFRRTRRYGREFSCISLRLDDLDELGVETAAVALRRVAAALAGALRTTDDAAYLFDGTFVVLAPETMANRASTLGQRLAERVQRDLDGLPGAGAAPPVGFVAFSFDGWNAAAPEEVVRRVLAG